MDLSYRSSLNLSMGSLGTIQQSDNEISNCELESNFDLEGDSNHHPLAKESGHGFARGKSFRFAKSGTNSVTGCTTSSTVTGATSTAGKKKNKRSSLPAAFSGGVGAIGSILPDHAQYAKSLMGHGVKNIFKLRFCILIGWALCSILLSVATYMYLAHLEQQEFETTFRQAAAFMSHTALLESQSILDAFASESEDFTALALNNRVEWPFLVVPFYERRSSRLRQTTNTQQVGFAPLVTSEAHSTLGLGLETWERFATYTGPNWIQESHAVVMNDPKEAQEEAAEARNGRRHLVADEDSTSAASAKPSIPEHVWYLSQDNETALPANGTGPFAPLWQVSPPPPSSPSGLYSSINYDLLSDVTLHNLFAALSVESEMVLSDVLVHPSSIPHHLPGTENQTNTTGYPPHTLLLEPVYDTFNATDRQLVGILYGMLSWQDLLQTIMLQEQEQASSTIDAGMVCVVENTCGSSMTFQTTDANGGALKLIGVGDHHDPKYHSMGVTASFGKHASQKHHFRVVQEEGIGNQPCYYSFQFYPSSSLHNAVTTNGPKVYCILLSCVFVAFGLVFYSYVAMIQKRQNKIKSIAYKATSVVASLFPATVRDRILDSALSSKESKKQQRQSRRESKANKDSKSKEFTSTDGKDGGADITADGAPHNISRSIYKTKPIADLFPEATVMFADISGFTAWSSSREPTQVFDLLETLYHTFDALTGRRNVFKVETIGDCYVGVCGVPTPRKDHAVQMARFARDCVKAMDVVTQKLAVCLGPGTDALQLRVGLHSGPVTAGVLRGTNSRFQLFGDTMNTAARMESNGRPGRVHFSQETANFLAAADKASWCLHRDEKINAKGKGQLTTYWLDLNALSVSSPAFSTAAETSSGCDSVIHPTLKAAMEVEATRELGRNQQFLTDREQRLIDWMVERLAELLKAIEARRQTVGPAKAQGIIPQAKASQVEISVFEEVSEVISMPEWTAGMNKDVSVDPKSIQLSPNVMWQLNDYVTSISTMYRKQNSFHNFEHASHVTQSVIKMLNRVVNQNTQSKTCPLETHVDGSMGSTKEVESKAHANIYEDNSFGISSDPLTQFALVFSALIHDVDHSGVSNAQLVKEQSQLARIYANKSVAEQNSVNIAWDLLFDPAFGDLRKCLFTAEEEYTRFRELVINIVMGTDIMDKSLLALRNKRWEKAFAQKDSKDMTKRDIDRKATIVLEHLIQASDVCHTMQHWHVYKKWNSRLFREMYTAYKGGRMDKNPLDFWYKGEIGFFDFYIIPLAKKLKECGVFGVSSDEYLGYAISNRDRWEQHGEEVVEELKESAKEIDKEFEMKNISASARSPTTNSLLM